MNHRMAIANFSPYHLLSAFVEIGNLTEIFGFSSALVLFQLPRDIAANLLIKECFLFKLKTSA